MKCFDNKFAVTDILEAWNKSAGAPDDDGGDNSINSEKLFSRRCTAMTHRTAKTFQALKTEAFGLV